jgi:hypothetical protein
MIVIMQRTIDYAIELSKDTTQSEQLSYINSLWVNVTKDNMMLTKNETRYVKIEDEEEA